MICWSCVVAVVALLVIIVDLAVLCWLGRRAVINRRVVRNEREARAVEHDRL